MSSTPGLGKGNQTVVLICNIPSGSENISVVPAGALPSTVKQLQPHAASAQLLSVSQTDKENKRIAKAEAKEKKIIEKQAKLLERQRKEEERRLKREKDEQEKKDKKERREAERKRKQEELEEKQEIKRRKEMEKKEKELQEEEKKKKVQNRFRGFFVSSSKTNSSSSSSTGSTVEDCQVNKSLNESLVEAPPISYEAFVVQLKEQTHVSTYLHSCKQHSISGNHGYRSNDAVGKRRTLPRFKLLQFSENHRPPYWGSWTRKSTVIKARMPFAKDKTLLDYSIDSDDEWEEEDPGESLSDSEVEEDNGDNEEDEDDGFFVPHGYLSDDELNGSGDEQTSGDHRQRKQIAKVKAWEAEFTKKQSRLIPRCISTVNRKCPLTTEERDLMERYTGVVLCPLPFTTTTTTTTTTDSNTKKEKNGSGTPQAYKYPVPEAAMPELIRLVHRSPMGLKRLIDVFRDHWHKQLSDHEQKDSPDELPLLHPSGISKRQLELKIVSIATKGSSRFWIVKPEVMLQYGFHSEDEITPLVIEPSPSRKTIPQQTTPNGMTDIKKFFTSPSNAPGKSIVKSLSLSSTPPAKRKRISLEPIILCDDKENEPPEQEAHPMPELMEIEPESKYKNCMNNSSSSGIDWEKQLNERKKISVSIDIHI